MESKDNGLILSIDLGTSNLKGAVYDINGKEIAYNSIEYNLYTPTNSIVENNVNNYWNSIKKILKNLVTQLGTISKNILVIGTSSQGETIVPLNKEGNPLRNAIVWIDTRSTKEADEIRNNFNIEEMYKKTGYADIEPAWPATRILWIKKNEPEIFSNTYKFLLLEDFILRIFV